jgi:hypothetical protein
MRRNLWQGLYMTRGDNTALCSSLYYFCNRPLSRVFYGPNDLDSFKPVTSPMSKHLVEHSGDSHFLATSCLLW